MTVISAEGEAELTASEKEVLREAGELVGAERWEPELAEQVL